MTSFGMASPKREGDKLWPSDYLTMNGKLPKRSFYTKEELKEHRHAGFGGDEWYADE